MGGYWDWAITQMTDASSTDVVVYIREKKKYTRLVEKMHFIEHLGTKRKKKYNLCI